MVRVSRISRRPPFPLLGDCYWLDKPCTRILLKIYVEKRPLYRKDFDSVLGCYMNSIRWLRVSETQGLIQSYQPKGRGVGRGGGAMVYQLTGKGEALAKSVVKILGLWNHAPLKVID